MKRPPTEDDPFYDLFEANPECSKARWTWPTRDGTLGFGCKHL